LSQPNNASKIHKNKRGIREKTLKTGKKRAKNAGNFQKLAKKQGNCQKIGEILKRSVTNRQV